MTRNFAWHVLRQWRSIEPDARPWIAVVETPGYLARARKLLTEVEQEAIVQVIARDPSRGVLVEGTGGIRKLRFGLRQRGKSGGVRVAYYFHSDQMPTFLLTVFAKNEKTDLTQAEKHDLAGVVDAIKRARKAAGAA